MNIALVHFRVGETDGVSLEMDKWRGELEKMNHTVYYISGNAYDDHTFVINELAYEDPEDRRLANECFDKRIQESEESLKKKIDDRAQKITEQMVQLIKKHHIDLLIPNNICALPISLAVSKGIYDAIYLTGVKAIGHHHDFYWERSKYQTPTSPFVFDYLNQFFPPLLNEMKHVVINSSARKDLMVKKHLDSTVVPNVFDFNGNTWEKDAYNEDFKEAYGLTENDIVILQATRVVNRKAIELAIDTIAYMNEKKEHWYGRKMYDGRLFDQHKRFVLLAVGLHEGQDHYEEKLIEHAKACGVTFILDPTKTSHTRKQQSHKIYALWDAYVHADLVSYPSIYEGFGNQFLEAVYAKKPLLLFEYHVFKDDIKTNGFHYASLGSTYQTRDNGLVYIEKKIIDEACQTLDQYLFNAAFRQEVVEMNYRIAKEAYSLETLHNLIKEILE